MTKRKCAFCEEPLTNGRAGTRAREHVFKKSWIKALNHKETQINLDHFRKETLVRKSSRPAIHFMAGDICNDCNSGWMNDLDKTVEPLVLGLARGIIQLSNITTQDAQAIGRWLLKTAVTFVFCDSKDRRNIPLTTLRKIREPGYMPDGFVVFLHQFEEPCSNLSACTIDALIAIDEGVSEKFQSSERLQFAIQYDQIVFGCCYVSCSEPTFIGLPGMHHPIYTKGANFFVDEELRPVFMDATQNIPLEKFFLNLFILGVTFWSEHDALITVDESGP